MSAVDLPFLKRRLRGVDKLSAASCILFKVMQDKIFLDTGTKQIGLRFSVFFVVWEWI